MFDVLRNEAQVMEGLHRLGIQGLSLHNVLKLNTQPSEADYAVDIRSSAIAVGVLSEAHWHLARYFVIFFSMRGKLFLPALLLASKIYHPAYMGLCACNVST